jgi:hypothetical protein
MFVSIAFGSSVINSIWSKKHHFIIHYIKIPWSIKSKQFDLNIRINFFEFVATFSFSNLIFTFHNLNIKVLEFDETWKGWFWAFSIKFYSSNFL